MNSMNEERFAESSQHEKEFTCSRYEPGTCECCCRLAEADAVLRDPLLGEVQVHVGLLQPPEPAQHREHCQEPGGEGGEECEESV